MEIIKTTEIDTKIEPNKEDITVFTVSGRIDTQSFEEFQECVESEINNNGITKVKFDFKNLEYLSSAGLRAILSIQKIINGIPGAEMVIKNANETVLDILTITGFTDFLTIE